MLESPGFLFTVLAFLVVLGPLVFVHEYGHYIVGRWCGVKAETFSIGFGRRILGWTDKRGTEWKIGWLPLGGYVQFAGDRDAVSQPDAEWQSLPAEERSHTFPAQPVWKRALIVAAGPVTNFLFAILILAGFAWVGGVATNPALIGTVEPRSAAAAAGLQSGDRILSIDGRAMERFTDIQKSVEHRPGEMMDIRIDRAGAERTIRLAPRLIKEKDPFGNDIERAVIGISPGPPVFEPVPLVEAPRVAVRQTVQIVRQTLDVLGQFLTGNRSIKDLSGPVKIAKVSGEAASLGPQVLIYFIALISINLGFINLLPLPMLDGGHLLFYGYEAVRRRPAPPQAQEWAFRFGFAAIVTLMLVVTFNDLGSIGVWDRIARLIG
ncbi:MULTISPECIES: RIP metalloprotease RseP [unclassified Sphingopyxis]|uniref:RIP metalloprotease RseP n=1 Tax=unclassified Sphingopyxis TaxID=2614943 RepID=UPI0007363FFB|nr:MULTISPECIES: RIP metalloprotease RseP [unclassified Sphingopyxis]KTE40109.1 RIP metalloprotease RseP [Sphingopyxis sp. HIX]KTE86090.1 RIP metalloprotease RseP [Sphingopyxis sp. HXXIV]